ncbi:hypothetical protein SLOPH_1657 [Spraguea lophii 42_110]|uniref:Uncharacterized protein n=1 Tax=Spraguea lophii (strain 42_110) TaxID=1358809 RepID=S7W8P2_SPRLO|nr:hypothetical protein SLOPH_1657 [Spraguea lophii 42_110]
MLYSEKLEGIDAILSCFTLDDIFDILDTVSFYASTSDAKENFFIPQEANFQLPTIFLRTKRILDCEKFIYYNNGTFNNQKIDKILKCLEDIVIDEIVFEEEKTVETNIQEVEELAKKYL